MSHLLDKVVVEIKPLRLRFDSLGVHSVRLFVALMESTPIMMNAKLERMHQIFKKDLLYHQSDVQKKGIGQSCSHGCNYFQQIERIPHSLEAHCLLPKSSDAN